MKESGLKAKLIFFLSCQNHNSGDFKKWPRILDPSSHCPLLLNLCGLKECFEPWVWQKWCCVASKKVRKARQLPSGSLGTLFLECVPPCILSHYEKPKAHRETAYRCPVKIPTEPSLEQPSPGARHVSEEAMLGVNPPGSAIQPFQLRPQTSQSRDKPVLLCPFQILDPQSDSCCFMSLNLGELVMQQ